jgi:hypothetical protein
MLIAAIVGLDVRSTMDLDTTLKNLPLTEDKILEAVKAIGNINLGDEVTFKTVSIAPIRKDDRYGGYCVRLDAVYDTIVTPLSMDVSKGDVITPSAVQYEFSGIFDDELRIRLWGYNIETVMAEKLETILSRGIFNTRPRDFYDIFILATTQKYDKELLNKALSATAEHRGSTGKIADTNTILNTIAESGDLLEMWKKYQKKFLYAKNISYDDIIEVIGKLLYKINTAQT